jgi:homoserine O-succinyltransferase
MPIITPKNIPAFTILQQKGVFVMDNRRANTQDIRPLRIGIVNLMPTKE